jgi:nucleotide-binding universal stress UspA family protein
VSEPLLRSLLAPTSALVNHDREIQEVVAIDQAYKAVLQHANTSKADLIVMGAQGMGWS